MRSRFVCALAGIALLGVALAAPAGAAVLTTHSQTFIGAGGSLTFTGDVPQCDRGSKGVDSLTLPGAMLAPVTAATQLTWTPSGAQTSAYRLSVIDPSGAIVTTWEIGANSTAAVTYSSPAAPSGPWTLHESGLPSSFCSSGAIVGTPGTASGTAGWYQP